MKRILFCMLSVGISTLQMGEASALRGETELIDEGGEFSHGFQKLVTLDQSDGRRKILASLVRSQGSDVTIDGVEYTFKRLRSPGSIISMLSDSVKNGKPMVLCHMTRIAGALALQYAIEVNPGKTWMFSLDFEKKEQD